MPESHDLQSIETLHIRQIRELAEWFGFETRNKYSILDSQKQMVGYAAEQQKGLFGALARHFLGHWRRFDIHIFSADRKPLLIAHHPFRFIFQRLEVTEASGNYLGALQQRFAFFSKCFDVQNSTGQTIMTVRSPFWKLWTFPFVAQGREVASIQKKWSGSISEIFTDRDNFVIQFKDSDLSAVDRNLVLAAAFFIDLQYFERKSSR